jgi:hypothetical protein
LCPDPQPADSIKQGGTAAARFNERFRRLAVGLAACTGSHWHAGSCRPIL